MLQFIEWLGCLVLYTVGVVMTIVKKNPIVVILIFCLHFVELILTGYKTGIEFGKKKIETVINTLLFGFTWWLPLKKKMNSETFTDADFVRTDHDFTMPETGVDL